MYKLRAFLFSAVIAPLLIAPMVMATGPPVCWFFGMVTWGGASVADGTTITAVVAGDEYTATTRTLNGGSTFAIAIQPPTGTYYPEGTSVAFKIDGRPAGQIGIFRPGQNIRLQLTEATSEPEDAPNIWQASDRAELLDGGAAFNWWVIIGLFLGLLVAASIAYYFVLLRRVVKKRLKSQQVIRRR